MIGEGFEKGEDSPRGMYIRSIADITKLYAISKVKQGDVL
jgi:hypothetical protein